MKKKFIFIIALLIILLIIFLFHDSKLSFLFYYQNIGKIVLEIDNNDIKLDDINIVLNHENKRSESKIKNGEFKFFNGSKGENKCTFTIPAKIYNGQTDIICEVEFISASYQNINDFNIKICVTTDNVVKVFASGFVKVKNKNDPPHYFNEVSKEIKENDNIILLCAYGI